MAISASTTSGPYQYASQYNIGFGADSNVYPATPLKIEIFKNGEPFYTFLNCEQDVYYPYTFNEPSSPTIEYSVTYTVNYEVPLFQETLTEVFTVAEFKPTFDLSVTSCAEKGQPFIFYPTNWSQNSDNTAFMSPPTPIDGEIEYKRYEFDMNSSSYVYKETNTIPLDGETGSVNGFTYAYQGGNWIPDVLTMVKFEVKVTNCNTSVTKNVVFPICGTWKIRRLACGNYRVYNYKNTNLIYTLAKGINPSTVLKTATIPAFSYIDLTDKELTGDGIYTIDANNITQYIFNYCAIETCMLDLHKRILLDDNLCDECKLDKVLYQKALRLLPTYETWKKLLDKDWVYDMQYKSNDVDGELARIYDAQELYLELIKLCDECSTSTKGCGCGC